MKRWFAEERVARGEYRRPEGQPAHGFDTAGDAMRWLERTGRIEWIANPAIEDGGYWHGWGDPWFTAAEERRGHRALTALGHLFNRSSYA